MKLNLINLAQPTSSRTEHFCSAGKKTKVVYKYVMNDKYGCPRRVPNGEINIQDMIQSYADDIDFAAMGKMLVANKENVVDHFALNGEIQDVTGLPRNIHEYSELHNTMMAEFEKMPDDLKALFGDFNTFSNAWKSNRIGSILDTYYQSKNNVAAVEAEKGQD